jgi:hypothetical protein
MPVDPVSPLGSDERVKDLDPAGVKGECVSPTPTGSFDSPPDVDSVIKSMASLCLHGNEAQAFEGIQPHDFNYSRLEHQLDAILGPLPSQEDIHRLYFIFINALA